MMVLMGPGCKDASNLEDTQFHCDEDNPCARSAGYECRYPDTGTDQRADQGVCSRDPSPPDSTGSDVATDTGSDVATDTGSDVVADAGDGQTVSDTNDTGATNDSSGTESDVCCDCDLQADETRLDCKAHYADDQLASGFYRIDPDGVEGENPAFIVYCDMESPGPEGPEGPEGAESMKGWTLIARYMGGTKGGQNQQDAWVEDFNFDANEHQNQESATDGGNVLVPPQICPGGNTYGHIRYDFFQSLNPAQRSIKLDCGPANAPVTHTEIRTGEFKSFVEGDYGDVGVSGGEWAVLRWTTTRANHMLCGQTVSSGIFQGGGIAYCEGIGSDEQGFGNHIVSFNAWICGSCTGDNEQPFQDQRYYPIGCNKEYLDDGRVQVWIH